ncbi:hypothetical protein P20439_3385 [Pseudoalteromonas sp. BSi20439]|nr:hypothetical protein P20439_3385 [Pseudoalteromonas sp. BSi20439]
MLLTTPQPKTLNQLFLNTKNYWHQTCYKLIIISKKTENKHEKIIIS